MNSTRPQCSWALGVLLAPEAHPSDDVRRAKVHAATCLHCADVLDDDDAGERVLDNLAAHRPASHRVARAVLGLLAAVQFAVAVPWLFGSNLLGSIGGTVTTSHLTRDGALGVAVGAAGMLTAWRPSFSRAMVLVCTVPILVQFISALTDGLGDQVGYHFELVHLVTPVIVALAVVVGRPPKGPTAERVPPVPLRVR